mmetsp:Transcript_108995/g.232938  ORF Transcript_108995/g.232938 Transcript_108995/m.232938 type:complete len:230 (-) Transcript_108995:2407-3096(-)
MHPPLHVRHELVRLRHLDFACDHHCFQGGELLVVSTDGFLSFGLALPGSSLALSCGSHSLTGLRSLCQGSGDASSGLPGFLSSTVGLQAKRSVGARQSLCSLTLHLELSPSCTSSPLSRHRPLRCICGVLGEAGHLHPQLGQGGGQARSLRRLHLHLRCRQALRGASLGRLGLGLGRAGDGLRRLALRRRCPSALRLRTRREGGDLGGLGLQLAPHLRLGLLRHLRAPL